MTPAAHGEFFSVNVQGLSSAVWEKRFGWEAEPSSAPVGLAYAGNGQVRIDVAGWYVIAYGVQIVTGTQGRRVFRLVVDAAVYQTEAVTHPSGSGDMTRAGGSGTVVRYLAAGALVAVEAYQNSGSGISWDGTRGTSWLTLASLAGPVVQAAKPGPDPDAPPPIIDPAPR